MRRADRLFQIIQFIRGRRVTTAAELARALEVSERTVYRDVRDLVLSGVPIEGEAGVGYMLRRGFDLPPLMFTRDEVEALVLGMRVVRSWADTDLGRAAESALDRIAAALPDDLKDRALDSRLFAPGFLVPPEVASHLGLLREAIEAKRKADITYRDVGEALTERTIRPLALAFFGATWMLTSWCELRQDFRNFRLDRMESVQKSEATFIEEPGKTWEDYVRIMEADARSREWRE